MFVSRAHSEPEVDHLDGIPQKRQVCALRISIVHGVGPAGGLRPPVFERIAAQPIQFLEATLLVEFVGPRVVSVDVPEEPFELPDFIFSDVLPDLEYRKV